jgi:phosphatidylglycerophosphatase A
MAENIDAVNAGTPLPIKPRLALAIATALGTGYAPVAPGTFGSLVGIVVAILTHPVTFFVFFVENVGVNVHIQDQYVHLARWLLLVPPLIAILVVGLIGVWSSAHVVAYAGVKDPQYVVVDEVSGMHLTLVLAIMPLGMPTQLLPADNATAFALYSAFSLLNWKYLLAAFLLFRLFDIWKPYPIRRLEKLPGGWGIMADDWMAGVYAALVLRVALYVVPALHFLSS